MTTEKSKTTVKKAKLVRDSFTIPKTEYAAIDGLKSRAVELGTSVKKSELLRAGLMALQALSDAAYKRVLAAVPALKTGRPATEVETAPSPTPRPAQPAVKKTTGARPAAKKAVSRTAKAQPAVEARPATARRPAVAPRKASASAVADKVPAKV
jgi:hypothetical protein